MRSSLTAIPNGRAFVASPRDLDGRPGRGRVDGVCLDVSVEGLEAVVDRRASHIQVVHRQVPRKLDAAAGAADGDGVGCAADGDRVGPGHRVDGAGLEAAGEAREPAWLDAPVTLRSPTVSASNVSWPGRLIPPEDCTGT